MVEWITSMEIIVILMIQCVCVCVYKYIFYPYYVCLMHIIIVKIRDMHMSWLPSWFVADIFAIIVKIML